MKKRELFVLAAAAMIACVALPAAVHAQTASVTGTTTDATGASVPGVTVTAKNAETNATRNAQTGDTGLYRIPNLLPGVYEILFQKQGFKNMRFTNVKLTVDQVLTLDVTIEISPVAQTVEVNAQTIAQVELDTAQISSVVDQQRIIELPLILRDPYQLILLSPGVVQTNGIGGFSVNGQRERNNNFMLDGVDNNDTEVPGIAGGITSLNPDATQEFRVITNNFLPEYGRNTGAIIDIITKSGSNDLHGNGYWFGRYAAQGARDFFNHTPDPASPGGVEPKAPYVRNDFGGSVGGPIRKDKTFWFANYEGQRFVTSVTVPPSTVPTAAFKTGVFTFEGTAVDLRPSSAQNVTDQLFGEKLGADPTIQKIFKLYPAPNGGSADDALTTMRGLLRFPSASRQTTDSVTAKVDHNFTSKQRFSARYIFNRFIDPNAFHTDFLPGLDAISTFQRTQNWSFNLTSTFSSTLINEARFGANRTNLQFNCGGISTFDGFGGVDPFGRGRDYGLPGISGFGCLSLGDSNGQARFTGTWNPSDTLTLVHGKHILKVGTDFHIVYSNSFDNFFSRAALGFNVFSTFGIPAIDLDPSTPCNVFDPNLKGCEIGSTVLQDMAWMYYGTVASHSQTEFFDNSGTRSGGDLRGFRQREFRVFGQDAYKVTPHFTFNYGLAWQFYGVPFEVNNQLSTLLADASGKAPFTFVLAGRGPGTQLYKNRYTDFEPRIGLAWDPFGKGKTSVRAAYGIFHDRTFGNLFGNARANPPFQLGFQDFPGDILPNIAVPKSLKASATVNDGDENGGVVLFDQNFRNPMTQSWNIGIQHQVFPNVLVDVNYVGSLSTYLFRVVDGNPPQPSRVAQLLALGFPASSLQFAILRVGADASFNFALPFNATNNSALFEPALNKSIAASNYHALQAKITKRMSHGFQVEGAYTWSHSIDNASDPLVPGADNRSFPRNSFNLQQERGDSDFDARQRLVINYIYEPAIGRGRGRWSEGVLGRIFEGWQLSGITTISSGLPFDIFGNRDNQHTGLSDRPDLIGNPNPPAGSDKTQTGPAVTAFKRAPFGRAGNLGRDRFVGPGIVNFDMTLKKTTALTERIKLDIRSEFYNIFNRTQFSLPGNNIASSGTFGKSFSQAGRPDGTSGARQIQFATKIIF
jgi:hypothetical protein